MHAIKATSIKNIARRFLLLFAGFVVAFYVLWKFLISESQIAYKILSGYAWISAKVLSLFGQGATSDGNILQTDEFSLSIATGCDGIEPIGYFLCAVLAFPAKWKEKIKVALWGSVALILLNTIRIISLYFIGLHFPSVFDLFHVGIWQVIMIVAGGLIWLYWITKMLAREDALI